MTPGYHTKMEESPELDVHGIKTYQEMIIMLRWAIELGHLAMPRPGHLEQVYHIFGYTKQGSRRRLFFDPEHPYIGEERFTNFRWEDFYRNARGPILADMPKPRGLAVSIHAFVDSEHVADNVTRRSQMGVLIFINCESILWLSNR